ncbi:hypothetical protein I545_2190 [Mycobacterium kansasii 662]|uniref:Uncharacterized protein n=1 Tax=Mycobacterium kansasii 662 TaxID=1299326 RepID=X7ZJZ1_MYCKA|nr:hypothetical protein I545_2190 [Mycobacterium kansasii 662]
MLNAPAPGFPYCHAGRRDDHIVPRMLRQGYPRQSAASWPARVSSESA